MAQANTFPISNDLFGRTKLKTEMYQGPCCVSSLPLDPFVQRLAKDRDRVRLASWNFEQWVVVESIIHASSLFVRSSLLYRLGQLGSHTTNITSFFPGTFNAL